MELRESCSLGRELVPFEPVVSAARQAVGLMGTSLVMRLKFV